MAVPRGPARSAAGWPAALPLAALCALLGSAAPPAAAATADATPVARVEARSADFLAVGVVRGGMMSIRLSRLLDNAPLRDAAVTVNLRGAAHPAIAEADGSFSLQAPELSLPGPAAVVFTVAQGTIQERLSGTLQIPAAGGAVAPSSAARQYGWWALNFAVCIGFLYLWSRRKPSDD